MKVAFLLLLLPSPFFANLIPHKWIYLSDQKKFALIFWPFSSAFFSPPLFFPPSPSPFLPYLCILHLSCSHSITFLGGSDGISQGSIHDCDLQGSRLESYRYLSYNLFLRSSKKPSAYQEASGQILSNGSGKSLFL